MFNICIIFRKIVNLHSDACWTTTEASVICTCLQIFYYLSEEVLVNFGLAPLVVYTVEKAKMSAKQMT